MRSKLLTVDPKTLRVEPLPELLLLEPFRSLVRRDKTEGKAKAARELAYISLFHDPRSPYASLSEDNRAYELRRALFDSKDYQPDDLAQSCAKAFNELKVSELERLLGSATVAISNLERFFREFDAQSEEDPALAVSRVIASLGKLGEVSAGLAKLKEAVAKEDEQKGAIRKGVQTTEFSE